MRTTSKRGMTFIEVILTIVIIALVAAVVMPKFPNVFSAANNAAATTRAQILNQAIYTYGSRIPNAATAWAATDDAGKYDLLYNSGYLSGQPATLIQFEPSGYTFTMPSSLSAARVAITGPSGALAY